MILDEDTKEHWSGPEVGEESPFLREDAVPFAVVPGVHSPRRPSDRRLDRLVDTAHRRRVALSFAAGLLLTAAIALAYRAQDATTGLPLTDELASATSDAQTDGNVEVGAGIASTASTSTPTSPDTSRSLDGQDSRAVPSTTENAGPSTTVQTTPSSPSTPPSTTAPSTTAPSPIELLPDSIELKAGKDKKIKVLGNDTSLADDLDEDTLTIVAQPLQADKYRVHDDHIHYRSIKDFTGTDNLTYRVCDEADHCAEATVTIVVTG